MDISYKPQPPKEPTPKPKPKPKPTYNGTRGRRKKSLAEVAVKVCVGIIKGALK